jgi:hypothetical protein
MIVASSCASRGISGKVVTLDEESVLAFIAATMMSLLGKGEPETLFYLSGCEPEILVYLWMYVV